MAFNTKFTPFYGNVYPEAEAKATLNLWDESSFAYQAQLCRSFYFSLKTGTDPVPIHVMFYLLFIIFIILNLRQ